MFQNNILSGERILVTGGGTGLGKHMARQFLSCGADVVIWGRRQGVLDTTAAELSAETGGRCDPLSVDIRNADAVEAGVDAAFETGGLTGLVNNAAGNFVSRTEDLSPRGFNAITDIVLNGTFYVTQACGKRWIANEQKGRVLSIVVTWVWTGSPYVVPSAMAKSGVAAMTRSLAAEWGAKGITLNAVAPGPFPTKGAWDRLMPNSSDGRSYIETVPMKRVGEYQELTNLATFLMAPGCDYLTGQVIAIDGGQMLTGGGTFSMLEKLTDDEWAMMRAQGKAASVKQPVK